jgi:F-type H+-transporting ATPase subunit gamma
MAGGQERLLRRRIRTVESTKKITRAMELIAASQIVRAQGRIAGSRPYVRAMEAVLRDTAADSPTSPLVGVPESPTNVLVLALVSDRGLCGAYNTNVLRATERHIASGSAKGRHFRLVTVGRRAESYFHFRHQPVEQAFRGMSDRPSYEDARRVSEVIVPPFLSGEVELVEIVSTRFVSAGTQVVERRQILPVLPSAAVAHSPAHSPASADQADPAGHSAGEGADLYAATPQRTGFFEYEPDARDLLGVLVPRYAEAELYSALLEAAASEHTARQRAMAAATENAEELIKTLRRVMNRARQDTITTEIMEIVGGAEALRQARGSRRGPAHTDRESRATEEQTA